jgi:hypothetical protein
VQVGAWLSLDGNPFNGNGDDIPMGGLCDINANLQPGVGGTPFCFDSPFVPMNARAGMQSLVLCVDTTFGVCGGVPPCSLVCETDDFNNCDTVPLRVDGPDAAVVDLSFPSTAQAGSPTPVTVTIENRGCSSLNIPVDVCIGPNCAPTAWFNSVPAGAQDTATVQVNPPTTGVICGGAQAVPVMACTKLQVDVVDANDCRTENISVIDQYWDLKFEIIGEPASAPCGGTIPYKVRVKNLGNVQSDNVCFRTGVDCDSGNDDWCCNWTGGCGGHPSFSTGIVLSGETKIFSFNLPVPFCCPIRDTQYLKVGILNPPCFDNCNPSNNNYDEVPIEICP